MLARAVVLVVWLGCGPRPAPPMPSANVDVSVRPFITGDVVDVYAGWNSTCYSASSGVEDCRGQRFSVEATCGPGCRLVPDANPAQSWTLLHVRPQVAGTMQVTVTLHHLTTHETFTKVLELEAFDPESLDLHCEDEHYNLDAPCVGRPLPASPIPSVTPVAYIKGYEYNRAERLQVSGTDPTRAANGRVSLATLFPDRMIRGERPGDERRMEPGRYAVTVSFGDLEKTFELEVR